MNPRLRYPALMQIVSCFSPQRRKRRDAGQETGLIKSVDTIGRNSVTYHLSDTYKIHQEARNGHWTTGAQT